jgi:SPP1 family predicted phage head-tail adaptor
MDVKRFLESGWEVWRWSESQDDYGGTTEEWAKLEDVSGLMRPLSGNLKMSADKETVFATHRFYCLPTDIEPGDQIRNGKKYEVKFASDMMNFGRLMQVDCEVIE